MVTTGQSTFGTKTVENKITTLPVTSSPILQMYYILIPLHHEFTLDLDITFIIAETVLPSEHVNLK
jgi:hypothetical protein